jgi:hypothetical protein
MGHGRGISYTQAYTPGVHKATRSATHLIWGCFYHSAPKVVTEVGRWDRGVGSDIGRRAGVQFPESNPSMPMEIAEQNGVKLISEYSMIDLYSTLHYTPLPLLHCASWPKERNMFDRKNSNFPEDSGLSPP